MVFTHDKPSSFLNSIFLLPKSYGLNEKPFIYPNHRKGLRPLSGFFPSSINLPRQSLKTLTEVFQERSCSFKAQSKIILQETTPFLTPTLTPKKVTITSGETATNEKKLTTASAELNLDAQNSVANSGEEAFNANKVGIISGKVTANARKTVIPTDRLTLIFCLKNQQKLS